MWGTRNGEEWSVARNKVKGRGRGGPRHKGFTNYQRLITNYQLPTTNHQLIRSGEQDLMAGSAAFG